MNNLLLIGDSFSSKTYIFELEYLLNEKFDSIYLLGESNRYDDIFMGCTCPINISTDIALCLLKCHTVFIIYTNRFTEDILSKTIDLRELYGKRIYIINTDDNDSERTIANHATPLDSTPTVLIVNHSIYTQCYIVELALNQYFVNERLKLYQLFSESSSKILYQLQNNSSLNSSINRTLKNTRNKDLIVKTIDLCQEDVLADITRINPIYTILVTESNIPQTIEDMFKEFYIRYSFPLNAIVKSQYTSVRMWNNRTDLFYKGNMEIHLADGTVTQSKDAISNVLLNDLANTVSLPDNINRVELDINNLSI